MGHAPRKRCHSEEPQATKNLALYRGEIPSHSSGQALRGVYPERAMKGILRFAQNDKRRAQDDTRIEIATWQMALPN